MSQPRQYKDIPTIKITPERQAASDYADGSYDNPYAKQDRRWMQYYLAFYDLTAQEMVELNNEIQGAV